MKNKNSKIPFFLFGICLFLLVGISCVRPFSTGLVRDAYIGSAFSFRVNDVIRIACPDLDVDKGKELQDLVETHPQMDSIIHRYLCACSDLFSGDKRALKNVDNESSFEKMNRDILEETKRRYQGNSMALSDEEFLEQLTLEEEEIEYILEEWLPAYGEPVAVVFQLYRALTSVWVPIVLILVMALCLSPLFVGYSEKFCRSVGKILLITGCFWAVALPVFVKAYDWRLRYLVDRILGRSMHLNVTPFMWRGGILIGLGLLLLILPIKKWSIRDLNP